MITVNHEAPSPFPVYTPKNERIIDERCACGHLRSEHADRFAYGHGHCTCALATPGVYCGCPQFTWVAHVFEHITAGDEKITPMPNVADCELHDFGAGVLVLVADHGVRDDKGRKIGGRVDIDPGTGINSGTFTVRVHATRDGVTFGALRKASRYKNVREALEAATRKVLEQRKAYARKYGKVAA